MCHHGEDGAMGLIINRAIEDLAFRDILSQLKIKPGHDCDDIRVHRGGPVETSRGFVLHSADYKRDGTLLVTDDIRAVGNHGDLRAIATGDGPARSLMALGYAAGAKASWTKRSKRNAWLSVPADADLLFSDDIGSKWVRALGILGSIPACSPPAPDTPNFPNLTARGGVRRAGAKADWPEHDQRRQHHANGTQHPIAGHRHRARSALGPSARARSRRRRRIRFFRCHDRRLLPAILRGAAGEP